MEEWPDVLRFSLFDLFKVVTVVAVLVATFRVFPVVIGLVVCIPVVVAYFVLDRCTSGDKVNTTAILGAIAGATLGSSMGYVTDLGLFVLAIRPDLPEQDFQQTFGVILGTLVGAVVGAIGFAVAEYGNRRLRGWQQSRPAKAGG
jgi:uncharacterized membrane protein